MQMDEHTFRRHLRVTWAQFDFLLQKLKQHIQKVHVGGRPEVPLHQKLAMFLWYIGNQNSFRELSDKFNVSQSTAHHVILEILCILCSQTSSFISWPKEFEKATSAAAFARICGINDIMGAIDGCHIKIQRPIIRGGDYLNRKGFYSVLLQGIVNEKGKFEDIFVGPPGRVHDARMLRSSTFYSTWEEKMGEYQLLGDSAYCGNAYPFVMTPKRDNGALSAEEEARNLQISRGRVIVEQTFGRMKCRWRRVRDLQNTWLDIVVMIIASACILHNLCADPTDVCEQHPLGCPRRGDENE
ncbi:putative nuclease HARBI1 [Scomber japonicus]|uniref:putative nuclease HARBI1 n=1 Tax=Scomber japonicus TaxID=13676 RepID=UPI0023060B09|nr:putative nuclease HARBI1 [Scomber japonicus]